MTIIKIFNDEMDATKKNRDSAESTDRKTEAGTAFPERKIAEINLKAQAQLYERTREKFAGQPTGAEYLPLEQGKSKSPAYSNPIRIVL